jgi:hypothetical protein
MLTMILNDISGVRPPVFVPIPECSGIDSTILCTYSGVGFPRRSGGAFEGGKGKFSGSRHCFRAVKIASD